MKLIIANWKSNHSAATAQAWCNQFNQLVKSRQLLQTDQLQVLIAPPYPLLSVVSELVSKLKTDSSGCKDDDSHEDDDTIIDSAKTVYQLETAVQDLSQYSAGAYTGEVSVKNLAGFVVKMAILGHSERRRLFNETDQEVAAKAQQAIAAQIKPVVCVDRSSLDSQAQQLLASQPIDFSSQPKIMAYEPTAAIGSGEAAQIADVQAVVAQIRQKFSPCQVLYGGSVQAENVSQYLAVSDGVLVGSASLDAERFADLIEAAENWLGADS